MKAALARRLILLLTLAALAPAAAAAADGAKVVGTWDMAAATPDGEMPSVLTVAEVEGGLKAEIEVGGMKRLVSGETLDGNVFSMKVQYEGALYDVRATIDGDAMEGTWEGGGNRGTLKGKRRP